MQSSEPTGDRVRSPNGRAHSSNGARPADGPTTTAPPDLSGRSTADLVRLASEQVSTLVRDEILLARTEMTAKGKRAATGAGLFGGAAMLVVYGVGALLVSAGLALALVLPAWLAALIVAVVLFAVAAGLGLAGRASFKRSVPPVPVEAVDSVKADVAEVRRSVHVKQ
jgi:Flp pilus assembly protein TadB